MINVEFVTKGKSEFLENLNPTDCFKIKEFSFRKTFNFPDHVYMMLNKEGFGSYSIIDIEDGQEYLIDNPGIEVERVDATLYINE